VHYQSKDEDAESSYAKLILIEKLRHRFVSRYWRSACFIAPTFLISGDIAVQSDAALLPKLTKSYAARI
jgi:hypothetical protein